MEAPTNDARSTWETLRRARHVCAGAAEASGCGGVVSPGNIFTHATPVRDELFEERRAQGRAQVALDASRVLVAHARSLWHERGEPLVDGRFACRSHVEVVSDLTKSVVWAATDITVLVLLLDLGP